MAMTKFIIPPDNSAYSVTDGQEVIATQLDGGAARYRRDILGATSKVNVVWTLGTEEYKYLRSFYRALCVSGSRPFLIDLILDEPTLTEHKVYFVPGSMQLTGQKGLTYFVACQLEVYPAEMDMEAEADFAAIYSYFGPNWKNTFPAFENELDVLVNIELPNDLAA